MHGASSYQEQGNCGPSSSQRSAYRQHKTKAGQQVQQKVLRFQTPPGQAMDCEQRQTFDSLPPQMTMNGPGGARGPGGRNTLQNPAPNGGYNPQ